MNGIALNGLAKIPYDVFTLDDVLYRTVLNSFNIFMAQSEACFKQCRESLLDQPIDYEKAGRASDPGVMK